ncbi:MAG: NERD domain-containing protein [Gammaproteobacteria bacterium]|nr:NERD domain-containing protein [Gammaproteobacteria bacterium]MBU1653397.1 NERD domain-containing protein [Gammaproteobacteria bacterium]MBU1960715.1 NERD domain-containing protein [Gammaproteobacteria bacterium]
MFDKQQLLASLGALLEARWPLILLTGLALIIVTPWFRRMIGGVIANLFAQEKLDEERYHLIRNVTLPSEEGSTLIDHIIVSIYGVFVVENKNLHGSIYGGKHIQTWTQRLGRQSCKFPNPLRQNIDQAKALAVLLGLADHQVHPLVLFSGKSSIKSEMPENLTQGASYIRYIQSKTRPVLSGREVQEIVEIIESGRLAASFQTHREHDRRAAQIAGEN